MAEVARTLAGRKRDPSFEWGALRDLAPYLWPRGHAEIKLRVVVALAFVVCAKLAMVYAPMLYKIMVDQFSDPARLPVELPIAL